ncbi:hypothetical protein HDU96_005432 [Phlyctochytrium bullatum]|nr:hypothetical protein HDU96_005432 [Phlyctochytrium bullatum]
MRVTMRSLLLLAVLTLALVLLLAQDSHAIPQGKRTPAKRATPKPNKPPTKPTPTKTTPAIKKGGNRAPLAVKGGKRNAAPSAPRARAGPAPKLGKDQYPNRPPGPGTPAPSPTPKVPKLGGAIARARSTGPGMKPKLGQDLPPLIPGPGRSRPPLPPPNPPQPKQPKGA